MTWTKGKEAVFVVRAGALKDIQDFADVLTEEAAVEQGNAVGFFCRIVESVE